MPGLGPARRTALLKHFGSVRKLCAASAEEIAAVPGIGPRLAVTIATALSAAGARITGNTGERHEDG